RLNTEDTKQVQRTQRRENRTAKGGCATRGGASSPIREGTMDRASTRRLEAGATKGTGLKTRHYRRGRLRAGEGGALRLSDGGERGFDDVEAFIKLFVGDHKRDEDANDVVEGARGDGDEAVLVAVARDLPGLGVGGLAWASRLARIVFRAASRGTGVANEFDGAHAPKAANIADEVPFVLPTA